MDISVYMPVYNGAKTIRRCIDSVLSQEFNGEWEFIIVDDGSEDETVMLIKDYDDPRIKLFERPHLQIVEASNFALEQCTGKYCARIDSDDVMLPGRLQKQYDFMEAHPEFGLTCGDVTVVYPTHRAEMKNNGTEIMMNDIIRRHPIVHSTVMFRSELGLRYEKEYEWAEDLHLYLEFIANGGRIFSLPEFLCDTYKHKMQATSVHKLETTLRAIKTKMKHLSSNSPQVSFFKNLKK